MATLKALRYLQALPVKCTAALILGVTLVVLFMAERTTASEWSDNKNSRTDDISTNDLISFMLPPKGFRMDPDIIKHYFWLKTNDNFRDIRQDELSPFWPSYFSFQIDKQNDTLLMRQEPGQEENMLADGLNSPDKRKQKAVRLWLRRCMILYFAGFRLNDQDPKHDYAPWIPEAQKQKINLVVNDYLLHLQPMNLKIDNYGESVNIICTDQVVWEYLTQLEDEKYTTMISYFDTVDADSVDSPTYLVYPLYLDRSRSGDQTTTDYPFTANLAWFMSEKNDETEGALSPLDGRVRLWVRDVYLAYITGKLLFENKICPTKDKSKQILIDAAMQQWWESAGK